MSSVNIDGHDYKRCGKCGKWTDFEDLMYIPPSREYDRAVWDRLDSALSTEKVPHETLGYVNVVKDDEAYQEYLRYSTECFGLDVCASCAIEDPRAYRAPTVTLHLQ